MRSPLLLLLLLLPVLAVLRLVRRRPKAGPAVEEPGPLPPGSSTVTTEDGVRLHVETDDVPGSPLTVLFVHGFTARLEEFLLQREALRGRVRVVLYDHRGHGRSEMGDVTHSTIDQLGRDLSLVLERAVPPGPVVLVGHSMGGMTLMALARQRPELFGPRVAGVFLLATSSGRLVDSGIVGAYLRVLAALRLLPVYLRLLQAFAPLLERLRKRGTAAGYAFTRRYLFGKDDASRDLVRLVQELLEETPLTTSAAFYATFLSHDETDALPVLARVPATVLCGTHDRLTPASHSRSMAERMGPGTELVVVPGAGHSVNITRPAVVDEALLALLDRVQAGLARSA